MKSVDASSGPSLKKRKENNTIEAVVLSDSSDEELSKGIIDDESTGERSIRNDFEINPDAGEDDNDQY